MAKTKNTFFSNVIDLFAKRAGEEKKIREVSVGCLKKRRGGGQNWNSLTLEIQNVL